MASVVPTTDGIQRWGTIQPAFRQAQPRVHTYVKAPSYTEYEPACWTMNMDVSGGGPGSVGLGLGASHPVPLFVGGGIGTCVIRASISDSRTWLSCVNPPLQVVTALSALSTSSNAVRRGTVQREELAAQPIANCPASLPLFLTSVRSSLHYPFFPLISPPYANNAAWEPAPSPTPSNCVQDYT